LPATRAHSEAVWSGPSALGASHGCKPGASPRAAMRTRLQRSVRLSEYGAKGRRPASYQPGATSQVRGGIAVSRAEGPFHRTVKQRRKWAPCRPRAHSEAVWSGPSALGTSHGCKPGASPRAAMRTRLQRSVSLSEHGSKGRRPASYQPGATRQVRGGMVVSRAEGPLHRTLKQRRRRGPTLRCCRDGWMGS